MNEELMSLLGNIQALLNEIKQALGGQSAETPPVNANANATKQQELTDEEKKKKEEEMKTAKKGIENTPSAGVDANDDSKKRIEEEPGVNEENIKDVTKALGLILKEFNKKNDNKMDIQKSTSDNEVLKDITDVLKQLASNMSNLQKKQETSEEAIMHILKGLKIADEVEKSLSQQQTQVQKGLNNVPDNEKMKNFIKSLITNNKQDEHESTSFGRREFVQKGLRDINLLKAMTVKEE